MIVDYIKYAEFDSNVELFCFRPEILSLLKFSGKKLNCKSKLKLGT